MTRKGNRAAILAAAGAPAGLAILAGAALAEPVTLRSFDGSTQLTGELVEFDGSTYTIETTIGTIDVSAMRVVCEGEACPEDPMFGAEFGIVGSNAVGAALMPALIEAYAYSLEGEITRELGATANESTLRIASIDGREMAAIALRADNSTSAFPALADTSAAIGMSSRRARDGDMALLSAAGVPDLRDPTTEQVVALDGLVAIVHPSNGIRAIALEDLAAVFGGEITNWSELGGPDAPITIHAAADDTGTFETFRTLVLDEWGYDQLAPGAARYASNLQLSDAVASDPTGIGFTGIAFERGARALPIAQECGLMAPPTEFAVKTEEYPLSRRLYIYRRPGPMIAHAERLFEFALSDDAQAVIEDAGYISADVSAIGMDEQGARLVHALTGEDEFSLPLMREMLNEIGDAKRLSLTFRFEPGSSQLDAKSLSDLRRFSELLAAGEFAGKEIMLVGFTDSIGAFDVNRGLALRRAQAVQALLAEIAGPDALESQEVTALGYGELTPVGCNTTFSGRIANRRVEVWVRDPS